MVRFKNRYITVEVDPLKTTKHEEWHLKRSKLRETILEAIKTYHGDFGVASTASSFMVNYCNKETRIGIIRCNHGPHKLIASILPFINAIDEDNIQIHTLYTGATLHQCYRFLKRYRMEQLRKLYSALPDCEKQKFSEYEKHFMDLCKTDLSKRKQSRQQRQENSEQ